MFQTALGKAPKRYASLEDDQTKINIHPDNRQ